MFNFINKYLDIFFKKNIKLLILTFNFIFVNYVNVFALASLEEFIEKGKDVVSILEIGITKGILLLTVIRLVGEYLNGANMYRIVNILKEGVEVLLMIKIIINLPSIIGIFIK